MGLLERWDRHNQEVMDRDRTRDLTEWTVGVALIIAINLFWVAGNLPAAVAIVAQAVVLVVAVVGIVRIVRRRRVERPASGETAHREPLRPGGSEAGWEAFDADEEDRGARSPTRRP